MDNSHVALVSMMLKAESFSPFRCDRNISLGVNLTSLTKVLRAAQNEDVLTLKAEDGPDTLNLMFESSENDRVSEYDLKLMDIDQEHLGIPETEYAASISMPSSEFRRICTDLSAMSESGTYRRKNLLFPPLTTFHFQLTSGKFKSRHLKTASSLLAAATSATVPSPYEVTPTLRSLL